MEKIGVCLLSSDWEWPSVGGARDMFICLKCVKKLEGKEERVCLAGDMGQGDYCP